MSSIRSFWIIAASTVAAIDASSTMPTPMHWPGQTEPEDGRSITSILWEKKWQPVMPSYMVKNWRSRWQ